MKGDIYELNDLKELLTSFAQSAGLRVNFDKSMMLKRQPALYLTKPSLKSNQAYSCWSLASILQMWKKACGFLPFE
jgi:hypothetical protein